MKLLFLFGASIALSGVKADQIDDVVANSILMPTSNICSGADASETAFSSVFTSTGGWNSLHAQYEEDAFDIEMNHHDETNSNHTWSMRIGKGGQIISFIGPYGEANANQGQAFSAWNDLVTQIVAVNNKRNNKSPYATYKYFIHGSGTYMKDDGMPPPFYNPQLASTCEGNQCTSVNWGQQAHVPTVHRSDVIYYQRYSDCGNGVIEYDQVIHHYGSDSSDILDYFNTPWSNVRTSTLPEMMISNEVGYLEEPLEIRGWGSQPEQIRNLDKTGGFTTFTQRPSGGVKYPYDPGFCISTNSSISNANVPCSTDGSIAFSLTTQADNTAFVSNGHVNSWGIYVVRMTASDFVSPVKTSCIDCNIIVTNNRTEFSFDMKHVIHWAWAGKYLYFSPSVTAAVINNEFKKGDDFVLTFAEISRDDIFANHALGLSFVHGKNPEFGQSGNSFYNAKSRMRWGKTSSTLRDGTVWTTNLLGNLGPQETYYNRKYLISGDVNDAEARASFFEPETFENVYSTEELNSKLFGGEEIHLHCDDFLFSATTGDDTCQVPGAKNICSGSSIPTEGAKPLYYVTCNGDSYVGGDPYNFAPLLENNNGQVLLKPYLCVNEEVKIRPTFKLLGFFNTDDCTDLNGKIYNGDACSTFSSAPSAKPTKPPTLSSYSPSNPPTLSSYSPSNPPTLSSYSPSKPPTLSSYSPSSSPTPPSAFRISYFKTKVVLNAKEKWYGKLIFRLRGQDRTKILSATITISYPFRGNNALSKCKTNKKGQCTIKTKKLPIDKKGNNWFNVTLISIVEEWPGEYNDNLNVEYENNCPVFSSNCREIIINKPVE